MAGDSVSTVEYYDPFAGRWQLASSMCTLRSRVGIAVFKGIFADGDLLYIDNSDTSLSFVCITIGLISTECMLIVA